MVDDISHEGLRALLREEGVTFQRIKTWKASKDPDYAVKKARVEHLYAIADREVVPEPGDPEMIFGVDEFGPLNLQPRPLRRWAAVSGKSKDPVRAACPGALSPACVAAQSRATANAGRNQHIHGCPWKIGSRCSGRANHRDPVTPPHLPGGKPGSGPPPGRDFQQWIGRASLERCQTNPTEGDPP